MCMQHTVILFSVCKWKRRKWLFFVVKRYAVREAKLGQYARGRGVTLSYVTGWTQMFLPKYRIKNFFQMFISTKAGIGALKV